MAFQYHVCLCLLVTLAVAFLSIPTATAQTGTTLAISVVTEIITGATSPEISTVTIHTTNNGVTTETEATTTPFNNPTGIPASTLAGNNPTTVTPQTDMMSASGSTLEGTTPAGPPYTGTGTPPEAQGTQTTATSHNGATQSDPISTTEAEGISPGSSNPQLSTLEMASQNVGDNATSLDTSSFATQENMATENAATTSADISQDPELSTLEVVSQEVGTKTTTGDVSSTASATERRPPEPVATTSGECEDCNPTEEPGLSPGEIAGIVIGSVAGAAIIGGGIGFAIYHFKAPTKVTPTTDIEIQDMSDSPEANSDRAKLTNASDTHTDVDA